MFSSSLTFVQSSFHFPAILKPSAHNPRQLRNTTATAFTKTESERQTRSQMATSTSSLYQVLGISMTASGNEIKAAYRRLARVCHPDVVATNQKENSSSEFMKIHAAYLTLSDPHKRAEYDRDLFGRRRPFHSAGTMAAAAAMSGFSGYSSRNWETDQCW